MAATEAPEVSELIQALRDYVDARNAALIDARRELGVNELDARALLFIADNPGVRPSQLRDYLGITSAGITTLVDRLISRETVAREPDEKDRRVVHLTALVDLENEPWSALYRFDTAFQRAADDYPVEQIAEFSDLLGKLTAGTTSRLP